MIKISLKPYSKLFIKILGVFLVIIGLIGITAH